MFISSWHTYLFYVMWDVTMLALTDYNRSASRIFMMGFPSIRNYLDILELALRVLYTIVEWLLKSVRQDNCVAALNRFYDF